MGAAKKNPNARRMESVTEVATEISKPLPSTGTVGRIVHVYHPQFAENGKMVAVPGIITRVRRADEVEETQVEGDDEFVYDVTVFHYAGTYPVSDIGYSEAPFPKCWSWPPKAGA